MKTQDLLLNIAVASPKLKIIGLWIIIIVSLWDFAISGARGFFEYSINWGGIALIWLGIALILISKQVERKVL